MSIKWTCPNCGNLHEFEMGEEEICEFCGYAEVEPEDDGRPMYL